MPRGRRSRCSPPAGRWRPTPAPRCSAFSPGFAIFLTVLSSNVFGDALRDVLDPRIGI
jgi:hypothetical protein